MPRSFGERYFATQPRPPRYAASGWAQLFSYVPQVMALTTGPGRQQMPAAHAIPSARCTANLPCTLHHVIWVGTFGNLLTRCCCSCPVPPLPRAQYCYPSNRTRCYSPANVFFDVALVDPLTASPMIVLPAAPHCAQYYL